MKELTVNKVNVPENAPWDDVFQSLEAAEWNVIDIINWAEFDYRPDVHFRMQYGETAFFLQYKVKEQAVRAIAAIDNGQVWRDSCVEFFVTPADDDIYYNFEFNCIGTALLSAGESRRNRESAQTSVLTNIRRYPSLGRHPFAERIEETAWDLTLVIPYTCIFKHPNYSPAGKTVRANFYKCGDDLTTPHFLSWNPIDTERPDFHRPEFFGTVKFL
jgi:hypothetical protein